MLMPLVTATLKKFPSIIAYTPHFPTTVFVIIFVGLVSWRAYELLVLTSYYPEYTMRVKVKPDEKVPKIGHVDLEMTLTCATTIQKRKSCLFITNIPSPKLNLSTSIY